MWATYNLVRALNSALTALKQLGHPRFSWFGVAPPKPRTRLSTALRPFWFPLGLTEEGCYYFYPAVMIHGSAIIAACGKFGQTGIRRRTRG